MGSRVLLIASLILCLLAPARADDWLPLVQGNYWVYRGPTKWTTVSVNGGPSEIRSGVLTCRMEITEVIRRGKIVAAVLRGHPADLAWYGLGDHRPGKYLIVRVGTGAYYLFNADRIAQTLQAIRAGVEPGPDGWLNGGELCLDPPLKVGKRFGGEPDNPQIDRNCWYVQNQEPFAGRGIAGLPLRRRTVFRLSYLTNPDHTYIGIVRGVGIVSYEYGHHGTVSATDLELVKAQVRPEKWPRLHAAVKSRNGD